jgi:hypothetical protein
MSDQAAPPRRSRRRIVLAGLAVCILGWTIAVLSRPETVVSWNTPLRYDDFEFSVTGVQTIAGAPAGRTRQVVSLRVDNRAKRVSFIFQPAMAVVTDSSGRTYPVSRDVKPAFDWGTPIPAGASQTYPLEFDLPNEARNSSLKITFGPVGDALDAFLTGRRRIRLQPPKTGR